MTLRDYQARALDGVGAEWSAGHRAVCLVAPTGSGKTVMGAEAARRQVGRVLWVTHRTELVQQSAAALEALGLHVGVIAGSGSRDVGEAVIVASWQTLVARAECRPAADLVVIDECHHIRADDWGAVFTDYPEARLLGLTATPQRGDGRPLGDVFSSLVVAAQYSELIQAGHLVACRLFRPPEALGSDLAQDPVTAYERYAVGKQAIVFTRSIEAAEEIALTLTERGHQAACISAKTGRVTRADAIEAFRDGELKCLTCVFTLTEGFDHPATEAVVLARGCRHVGTYLQMVGRVLRPAPGKTEAIVVDLPGLSWTHGTPTEDRVYALTGRAISSSGALRVCPACGHTYDPADAKGPGCPECGFVPEQQERPAPRIYDMDLAEVYAGAQTADAAKVREYERLRKLAGWRGWSIGWVVREYRKLFDEAPRLDDVSDEEWQREFRALTKLGAERGFKPGFALVRFKELSGRWPRREWRT